MHILSNPLISVYSPSLTGRGETRERRCFNVRRSFWTGGRAKLILWRAFRLGEHAGSVWAWPRQAACSQLSCHTLLLLQVLRAAEKRRVGQAEKSGSTAVARSTVKALSLVERRSCSHRWRRNRRSFGECLHYIAICSTHCGGLSSHRLCSSAAEPLVNFQHTAQTNGRAVTLRC